MKVSELAMLAGLKPSAIRFYERAGVLPRARRGESGYRDYDESDLHRVRVLATLRALGLDLQAAGKLAAMCSDGHCEEMAAELTPEIEARRVEIANARVELDYLEGELDRLAQRLRDGEPRAVLKFGRWDHAEADHDQAGA